MNAYLDVAESMALRKIRMTMQHRETRLNRLLDATDHAVLSDAGKLTNAEMDEILKSHVIDPALLRGDSFDEFYAARKASLLAVVERAMGKPSAASAEAVAEDGEDDEADPEPA
jgi:hypothetical protein